MRVSTLLWLLAAVMMAVGAYVGTGHAALATGVFLTVGAAAPLSMLGGCSLDSIVSRAALGQGLLLVSLSYILLAEPGDAGAPYALAALASGVAAVAADALQCRVRDRAWDARRGREGTQG